MSLKRTEVAKKKSSTLHSRKLAFIAAPLVATELALLPVPSPDRRSRSPTKTNDELLNMQGGSDTDFENDEAENEEGEEEEEDEEYESDDDQSKGLLKRSRKLSKSMRPRNVNV